mgnify:CR=1 FL=1|tara:strand:- start:564 stop:776 length:213 start_codon:yes stop_codon:yes gene_type:complete
MEINPNTGTYNVTFEPEEFDTLYAIIADRLNTFQKNINRKIDGEYVLNEEERDIRNYKTYDLFTKLGGRI